MEIIGEFQRTLRGGLLAEVFGLVAGKEARRLHFWSRASGQSCVKVAHTLHAGGIFRSTDCLQHGQLCLKYET